MLDLKISASEWGIIRDCPRRWAAGAYRPTAIKENQESAAAAVGKAVHESMIKPNEPWRSQRLLYDAVTPNRKVAEAQISRMKDRLKEANHLLPPGVQYEQTRERNFEGALGYLTVHGRADGYCSETNTLIELKTGSNYYPHDAQASVLAWLFPEVERIRFIFIPRLPLASIQPQATHKDLDGDDIKELQASFGGHFELLTQPTSIKEFLPVPNFNNCRKCALSKRDKLSGDYGCAQTALEIIGE